MTKACINRRRDRCNLSKMTDAPAVTGVICDRGAAAGLSGAAMLVAAALIWAMANASASAQEAQGQGQGEGNSPSVPLQLVPDLKEGVEEDLQTILQYYQRIQEFDPGSGVSGGTGGPASPSGGPEVDQISEILSRLGAAGGFSENLDGGAPYVPVGEDGSGGRDPFAITARLQRVSTGGIEGVQFVPKPETVSATDLPKMRLRGLIRTAAKSAPASVSLASAGGKSPKPRLKAALLEIDGAGVYVVREGDTVGLHRLGKTSVLKIVGVTELSVVVEIGTLGEVIVVR